MKYPTPDAGRSQKYYAAGLWRSETIPQRMTASIAALPEKLAVRDAAGCDLTYRELDAQSIRLAGFLRSHGVGAGDVVIALDGNRWMFNAETAASLDRIFAIAGL